VRKLDRVSRMPRPVMLCRSGALTTTPCSSSSISAHPDAYTCVEEGNLSYSDIAFGHASAGIGAARRGAEATTACPRPRPSRVHLASRALLVGRAAQQVGKRFVALKSSRNVVHT